MAKKYRKKPVVIEAVQYDGKNFKEILEFIGGEDERDKIDIHHNSIFIKTLEGDMHAKPNDFIIKGVKGEFYPCREDIFYETYEEVIDA
jgi:hypothetical protein